MGNPGQIVQGIGEGLSLLNPAFSVISMIGGLMQNAEKQSQAYYNSAQSWLGSAQNALTNLNSIDSTVTAHENNITRLNNAIETAKTNKGRIKENMQTLATNYKGLQRQLEGQGSQVSSYQDLLYAVSGVKNESGSARAIRDFSKNQLAEQGNQMKRSYEVEKTNLENVFEDLDDEIENLGTQKGFERGAIQEISGAGLPEGYDNWEDAAKDLDWATYYPGGEKGNPMVKIDMLHAENDSPEAGEIKKLLKGTGKTLKDWLLKEANSSWMASVTEEGIEEVLRGERELADKGLGYWVGKFLESDMGVDFTKRDVYEALTYLGYGDYTDMSKYTKTIDLETGEVKENEGSTDDAVGLAEQIDSLLEEILKAMG